jgi:hypothetical protein
VFACGISGLGEEDFMCGAEGKGNKKWCLPSSLFKEQHWREDSLDLLSSLLCFKSQLFWTGKKTLIS